MAAFLASENLWPAVVVGDADEGGWLLRLTDHPLELVTATPPPATARCLVGIRPEEVMLLHPDRPLRPQVSANVVEATVAELLLLDGRVEVALAAKGAPPILVR